MLIFTCWRIWVNLYNILCEKIWQDFVVVYFIENFAAMWKFPRFCQSVTLNGVNWPENFLKIVESQINFTWNDVYICDTHPVALFRNGTIGTFNISKYGDDYVRVPDEYQTGT